MFVCCVLLVSGWLVASQPDRPADRVPVTASELANALYYNQAAFDTHYHNRRLTIVGKATTIRRTDEPGQYLLSMRVGSRDYSGAITFLFDDAQRILATLNPPTEQVTIEGQMTDMTFNEGGEVASLSISLRECRLVGADATINSTTARNNSLSLPRNE